MYTVTVNYRDCDYTVHDFSTKEAAETFANAMICHEDVDEVTIRYPERNYFKED